MPETGRLMGLKITSTRDDRRDLYKSTHAAAKYLRDLHRELGDWLLVIAAYNGGPARVESAMRKSKSKDFWKLQYYLPAESRNHVKKFIATHYIMEGQGGVTTTVAADLPGLVNQEIDEALLVGTEMQLISGKYHSMIIAKNLGMDIISFNALNPGFDAKVGVGEFPLRLPMDKMTVFNANKMQILGESVQFMHDGAHRPRPEAGPGAIAHPEVERHAGDRHVEAGKIRRRRVDHPDRTHRGRSAARHRVPAGSRPGTASPRPGRSPGRASARRDHRHSAPGAAPARPRPRPPTRPVSARARCRSPHASRRPPASW